MTEPANSVERAAAPGAQAVGAREARRVAEEFAALLFFELLKAMRASVPEGGLFGESLSRDVYTAIADMEIAREMARREGAPLAKLIGRALAAGREGGIEKAELPAEGRVSSGFGLRIDPFTGERRGHAGIDIAAPSGSLVRAVAAGTVVQSGWAGGYGRLVAIDHGGGTVTRYGHNRVNLVGVGERVEAGQPIALVGDSGRATGAHLHFELLRGGRPVDPAAALARYRALAGG
jgi:murein DD-endopeptidase MepM/ murein hydrolase activator NlpD